MQTMIGEAPVPILSLCGKPMGRAYCGRLEGHRGDCVPAELRKFEMSLPVQIWEAAREAAARAGLKLVPWLRQLAVRELAREVAPAADEEQVLVAMPRKQRDAVVDLVRGAIAAGWARTSKAKENLEQAIDALEHAGPKAAAGKEES
jgi:hypothetical protein